MRGVAGVRGIHPPSGLPGQCRAGARLPWPQGCSNILDMPDYYNLLGVPPDAPPARIRAAFRTRAKAVHPDAHPHLAPDERAAMQRRFILLAQAYETLSDPARRSRYDRQRRAGQAREQARAARPTAGRGGDASRWAGTRAGFGRGHPRGGTAQGSRGAGDADTAPPGESLDDLLADVESLLGRFGLSVRPPFEALLDSLLDWAREVFRRVVDAWEAGAGDSPSPGDSAAGAGRARGGTERPGPAAAAGRGPRAGRGEHAGPKAADAERVREELDALRRRVRSRPTGQTDVEDELRRLKERLGRKE